MQHNFMWIKTEHVASINRETLQGYLMSQTSSSSHLMYCLKWGATSAVVSHHTTVWKQFSRDYLWQDGFNRKEISTRRKCDTYRRSCMMGTLLLKHWRGENRTTQSVESVALHQCLRVVMETARTVSLSEKDMWVEGIYYLTYTVMVGKMCNYEVFVILIISVVHLARWSYWRPHRGSGCWWMVVGSREKDDWGCCFSISNSGENWSS